MSAGWTHALCDPCYLLEEPERRVVHRVTSESPEICCGCGSATRSGIYYRAEPERFDHCQHDNREEPE